MWPKIAGLAVIEAALLALLFLPIPTHAVLYDPAKGAPVPDANWQALPILGAIIMILALVVVPWLA